MYYVLCTIPMYCIYLYKKTEGAKMNSMISFSLKNSHLGRTDSWVWSTYQRHHVKVQSGGTVSSFWAEWEGKWRQTPSEETLSGTMAERGHSRQRERCSGGSEKLSVAKDKPDQKSLETWVEPDGGRPWVPSWGDQALSSTFLRFTSYPIPSGARQRLKQKKTIIRLKF